MKGNIEKDFYKTQPKSTNCAILDCRTRIMVMDRKFNSRLRLGKFPHS